MRLLFLPACVFVLLAITECVYFLSDHSLAGPYDETNKQILNWHFTGSKALLDTVLLTPGGPNTQGSIWNRLPCNSQHWELQANFKIYGDGKGSFGNGMAIWYAREPAKPGPVFGSKDFFSGLGVFIDTYEDPDYPHEHSHPYISAMVSDGRHSYGHDEGGTFYEIGGCHANVRNRDYDVRIAVSYSKDDLTVYLDADGIGQWELCFASNGVYLPTGYYFGVTASTGEVPDHHEILSVTTLDLTPQGEPVYDKSQVVPSATNFRQRKVPDETIVEEVFRPMDEPKPEEQAPLKEPEPEPEVVIESKPEDKPHVQEKSQWIEKEPIVEEPPKYSWMYMGLSAGVLLIGCVYAVKWCNQYRARKKEILQKRLY